MENMALLILGLLLVALLASQSQTGVSILALDENKSVPVNITEPLEGKNLPVAIQDQSTQMFDLYFVRETGTQTTLSTQAIINSYNVSVASAAGFSVGNYIEILGNNRFYYGEILAISGATITLDTPICCQYPAGSTFTRVDRNMNKDGSSTRLVYSIRPSIYADDLRLDINSIVFQIATTDNPSYLEFGDISALSRGVVLRKNGTLPYNLFNVKLNAELSNHAYEFKIINQSFYGISSKYAMGGNDNHGVVVRLDKNNTLDIIIQDNLTSLVGFRAIAEGHVVQ